MFKLCFDFENREWTDTKFVNEALSALRLSSVQMDSKGYLAIQRTYDSSNQEKKVQLHYGFDCLELECETNEEEGLFTWQIQAYALPKGEVSGSDAFHEMWCCAYPNRIMRVLQEQSFENVDVYIVLYHEKEDD